MLNKKKSPKTLSLLRLGEPGTLSWLSSSQYAQKSANVAGTLFSVKSIKLAASLPEEPLTSEVQALLNSATNVIECATGGHGRCANNACGCRCHRARARTRGRRRLSI
jgi:hypothetical protein